MHPSVLFVDEWVAFQALMPKKAPKDDPDYSLQSLQDMVKILVTMGASAGCYVILSTAEASVDQIQAIRTVLEHQDIKTLPHALQDYIRLRVTYPDATLKELGEKANPPLSKSAIYHRVRRIEQMANDIGKL